MLKKSLSHLLGFILLVSTISTTIFANSAETLALPEDMLNDIIYDGELVLADFSDINSAEQELANLVTISSTDGATASISTEHLISTGATSSLKLSNLAYDNTSKTGSSFYIKSKYDTTILPSSYSIRIYFGIKSDDDSIQDKIPLHIWSEIQSDGECSVTTNAGFTLNDNGSGDHSALQRYYTGSTIKTDWTEYETDYSGSLQLGVKVSRSITGDNNTVYIEKITAVLNPEPDPYELTSPTPTVADGGVYTISDSYNPHSFALDFEEVVYVASDAVTVTADGTNITDVISSVLSGNTLNLTFPADIDYTKEYKVSLAKSKVRSATGKTLSSDAVYNFTWNIVKLPLFTNGKLILADFANNPTQEYIDSVITNTSDDITISTSGVHFSEGSVSSIEVAATADGTFYVQSAYTRDILPDEYKIYMKFGIVEDVANIRFQAYSGLGSADSGVYTETPFSFTVKTTNEEHLAGVERAIVDYAGINALDSVENELSFKINIKNVKSTCGVDVEYPGNNKFYIEQIYAVPDCEPLGYPAPSVAYGTDADELDEYILSFDTSLHYGEDAISVYKGNEEISNDEYVVTLHDTDLVVKFNDKLADGVYKVILDSDKILAKNGDVLYGDAEYAFSINTPDSGLDTYYMGTIGVSSDYMTARVPVIGTVGESDIKFLAAVYDNDGLLSVLHTDDLADGELKFDSLNLSSTQTIKYMLLKDMDTIMPLCKSVSNK